MRDTAMAARKPQGSREEVLNLRHFFWNAVAAGLSSSGPTTLLPRPAHQVRGPPFSEGKGLRNAQDVLRGIGVAVAGHGAVV